MFSNTQPRQNTGDFLKKLFLGKNILSRLILINTVIFLLVNIVGLFALLFNLSAASFISPLAKLLALPADLSLLASKPWTIFTYMFLQEGFFHLLFNMVMLYFGGLIFQEYLNQQKLLWTYIFGGLFGGIFFVISFNVFPAFNALSYISIAMGASASVLAIIIAISTYVPDYSVHLLFVGRLKLKYLAIAFILIDLLSIRADNPGGHIAHLGGALWGFLYAYSLKRNNDVYKILYGFKLPKFTWSKKEKRFDTPRADSGRPLSDDEYNYKRSASQEEIDLILDKISKSGYGSLSKKEKELLFKTSNKS
ncbi:MAG: rhomboid family intramembrane serine protease [Lentimicrobiaceae bacterium]|jgi:membrane associated rhomboid family serine protease|nr:rhomboid family intramembrane serine protease [Lentimicrobiaceae bacterium]MCP4911276.1 rhomboid family intramembrane serine protease [Bacteroidota bacterium]MBT3454085.1 rhomboid family intramembrane serine protease [Lentimicrobiaceae bacterium]MBT3818637.1 rhomboid family intramembrane serine protease [Lentimicrobiaceae bacterium]MBT4061330.1 rhomboid family intramembrane serine protease [Lentimicrobiaceae bacterium]